MKMNKREFLSYMAAGTAGTLALGWLFPRLGQAAGPREASQETLCSLFPYNSRCEGYLPGVRAQSKAGEPLEPACVLEQAQAGDVIPAQGLEHNTYLVVESGPEFAQYGIKPICTHRGCTVNWVPEQDRFICPCHGSQYDDKGRVVRGPAKEPPPLATVVVKQGQIRLIERAPGADPRVKDRSALR